MAVMDADTWLVAHQILGYISIPSVFLFFVGIRSKISVPTMFVSNVMIWIFVPGILSLIHYIRKYH